MRFTIRDLLELTAIAGMWALLVAKWISDRPSPAYPFGRVGEIAVLGTVLAGLTIAVVVIRLRATHNRR